MFEKEWLPYALSIGVSYDEFWRMNPHILKSFEESHRLKTIEQDNLMWTWWGNYGLSAVSVAVERVLAGRKAQLTYIDKPLLQNTIKNSKAELTEEEKQREVDLFFKRENARRLRWQRNKRRQEIENN